MHIKQYLTSLGTSFTPAQCRAALFWIFIAAIFLFPLGRAFQVTGPLLCLPFLLFLYWKDWKNCNLRHLPVRWIFLAYFGCIFLQLVFSQWPGMSWRTVSPNIYRGYILLFAGIECVRSERDLKYLILAYAGTSFYEGMDGIWQYVTGLDFLKNDPMHMPGIENRLTGSFGGMRVGDYMALLLLPAMSIWYMFPTGNRVLKGAGVLLVLFPALFLWIGAQARSGYLGVAVGLYLLCVFILNKPRLKTLLVPICVFILIIFSGPSRVTVETAMKDGRIPIWSTAFKTIQASPWIGTGAGTFTPALTKLGLVIEEGDVQHPHNVYLQWLVDGGIVSFIGFGLFFATVTIWTLLHVHRGVRAEQNQNPASHFWRYTAFFWVSWIAYMVINLAGHGFYRVWLTSTGLTALGIILGACVCSLRQSSSTPAPTAAAGDLP